MTPSELRTMHREFCCYECAIRWLFGKRRDHAAIMATKKDCQ